MKWKDHPYITYIYIYIHIIIYIYHIYIYQTKQYIGSRMSPCNLCTPTPKPTPSAQTKALLAAKGTIGAFGLPVVGIDRWIVELTLLVGWHDGIGRAVNSRVRLFPTETALVVNPILRFDTCVVSCQITNNMTCS